MLKVLLFIVMMFPAFAGDIRMIGQTSNSKYIAATMGSEEYIQGLMLVQTALDNEIASTFVVQDQQKNQLKLRKFSLGLAVTGEIGLGAYKYGGTVKQRFVYSR